MKEKDLHINTRLGLAFVVITTSAGCLKEKIERIDKAILCLQTQQELFVQYKDTVGRITDGFVEQGDLLTELKGYLPENEFKIVKMQVTDDQYDEVFPMFPNLDDYSQSGSEEDNFKTCQDNILRTESSIDEVENIEEDIENENRWLKEMLPPVPPETKG